MFFLIKYLFKISKKYDCAIAFRVGFCAEVVAHCVDADFKLVWWHHGECNYDEKAKREIVKNLTIILGKERMISLTAEQKVAFVKCDDVQRMERELL